jgi:GNAT superfamily N-acetyltransferase
MTIVPLQHRPDAIPTCARWAFDTWGGGQAADAAALAQRWRQDLAAPGLPLRWVALDGDTVLGMAALLADDLPARPDLFPWLGDVFTAPAARGRGVASALVHHVEAEAAALGHRRLYLFTDAAESLYARLGWHALGPDRGPRGETVTVMWKDLG